MIYKHSKSILNTLLLTFGLSGTAYSESISNKVYEIEDKMETVEKSALLDSYQIKHLEKKALNQDEKLLEIQLLINALEKQLSEKKNGEKAPRYSFP
jgi:Mg2+ and Co2+ transporter CorA